METFATTRKEPIENVLHSIEKNSKCIEIIAIVVGVIDSAVESQNYMDEKKLFFSLKCGGRNTARLSY